jgi:glycosyltransferase involved in cell wall biosynthesis
MPRNAGTKLRVLMVAPTPFFADRGCHVRIYEQCRALQRAGHEVVVCTYHLGRDLEDVEIRRCARVPWYRKMSAGPSVHKFYIDLLLLATVVREALRQRPAIVHAHLHEGVVIGWVAALLRGTPLVADLQGSLAAELCQHKWVREGGLPHRLFHAAERLINRLPHVTLASSSATRETLAGMHERQRSLVLPDGVDAVSFYPDPEAGAAVRHRLGISADEQVVGFLGMLTEYQGVSVLLKAAQHVLANPRPVRFLVMGYPHVEEYRDKARAMGLGDRVIFTGRVPYEQARAHLSACDVAVSPKVSATEANGKLVNYLAVGLPVIASDTPVNREILEGAGVLTAPGDSEALAAAIGDVLENEQLRNYLRGEALQRAMKLSWESLGERLVDIYSETLAAHGRTQGIGAIAGVGGT